MKEVTLKFRHDEYALLQADANKLQISVRQLIRNRALEAGCALCKAMAMSAELSLIREQINRLIRQETDQAPRLYEDDLIRLEMTMTELEQTVTRYISDLLTEVRAYGQPAI